MKRKVFAIIAVLAVLLQGCGQTKIEDWTDIGFCMHALGATEDGDVLTNTMEAFDYNYDKLGARLFEADIQITSDGVAVLRHDWASDLGQGEAFGWTEDNKYSVTLDEFLAAPIYGKYQPSTLLDLYKKMEKKKDVYVVLDPKFTTDVKGQFETIVNTAIDNGLEDVLDRVVVQLYYEDMLGKVEEVYSFKNYLLTLYYLGDYDMYELAEFCKDNEVPVITMHYDVYKYWGLDALNQNGIMAYVHTVNDLADAYDAFSGGVCGIYTDTVTAKAYNKKWAN